MNGTSTDIIELLKWDMQALIQALLTPLQMRRHLSLGIGKLLEYEASSDCLLRNTDLFRQSSNIEGAHGPEINIRIASMLCFYAAILSNKQLDELTGSNGIEQREFRQNPVCRVNTTRPLVMPTP